MMGPLFPGLMNCKNVFDGFAIPVALRSHSAQYAASRYCALECPLPRWVLPSLPERSLTQSSQRRASFFAPLRALRETSFLNCPAAPCRVTAHTGFKAWGQDFAMCA